MTAMGLEASVAVATASPCYTAARRVRVACDASDRTGLQSGTAR